MSQAEGESGEGDFGRYLASVAERDIDLLLMEEFHISGDFVAWFCGALGIFGVEPAGAWHSVSDMDGETDLLLRVVKDTRRIGILIENKVGAPEQDLQAERYHLRGIRSRESGKIDDYVTVMCAPQRYLDGLAANSAYEHRFPYERIAEWYGRQEGRRAAWRHRVMTEAIEQGRRGYQMATNAVTTAFHMSYWEHLRLRHPRIQMARPADRGSKSNWIIMKGLSFPRGVQIHHKFDQQVVELGFSGRTIDDILAAEPHLPENVAVVKKGKTASLSIQVPHVDMKLGVEAQLPAVEKALEAVYRLMPFATLLDDRPALRSTPTDDRRAASS
jgi:hypothetical protein